MVEIKSKPSGRLNGKWHPKEFVAKNNGDGARKLSKPFYQRLFGLRYAEDIRCIGFVAVWCTILTILWCWGTDIVSYGGSNENDLHHISLVPFNLITIIDFHYTYTGLALYGFLLLINTWLSFASSVITHSAVHTATFYSEAANDIYKLVLGVMYGIPVSIFLPTHNLSHHKYTQMRKDVSRTYKVRHDWNLINFFHYPFMWYQSSLPTNIAYFKAQRTKGRPIWYQFKFQATFLVLFHAIAFYLSLPKTLILLMWPQQFGQQAIGWTTLMQHDGMDMDLLGFNHSRNFTGGIYNWLLINAGYHTIHHMYPGIHWSRYKALHDEKVAPYIHPGCNEPNNLSFWFRYFVYPGIRTGLDGKPWELPEAGDDEEWFFDSAETYSSTEFEYEAWAPDDEDLKRAVEKSKQKLGPTFTQNHAPLKLKSQ